MTNSNLLNQIQPPESGSYDNALVLNGTVADNSISSSVKSILATVTLAESNAGATILAGITGKTINVVGFNAKVAGNYATTTSVVLEDTNGTPVAIATCLVAALTDGAVLNEATANVTMGAGYLGALTAGEGIAVTNTGTAATGGTSITFKVDYYLS